jgi:hypothetical protein
MPFVLMENRRGRTVRVSSVAELMARLRRGPPRQLDDVALGSAKPGAAFLA